MPDFPPLPLTAFEEYMLSDDRPQHPVSIVARLRFAGQLDRRATAEALDAVVARHPLLRAVVRKTSAGRLEWIAASSPSAIQWLDGPAHDRLPSMRPIDLFSEPGLRAWAASAGQSSSLVLQVHHAACDGKAVCHVLDEFVRSYAHLSLGTQSSLELPFLDPQTLQGRGRSFLTARKYLRMLPAQLAGLSRVWMFFVNRPVPLLKRIAAISAELPASFPTVKTGRLEAEAVRRLSLAAANSRVTVNDWLSRDFFVAVDDFRARHQATIHGEWIRVAVPMNLRHEADKRMPAANVVSMVFLDRTAKQIANSAGLLRSIHAEMDSILRRELGLIFIIALWVLRRLPGGLARRANRGFCETTCVLSNLGRAMADSPLPQLNKRIVAGDVLLSGVDFFTPVRDGTAVSVALIYYADELELCLHYDSRHVTEPQAEDLMATYLQKIHASLDQASRPSVRRDAAGPPQRAAKHPHRALPFLLGR